MARPRSRTIRGKPEPSIRLRLAIRAGKRFPAFRRMFRADWLQTVHLCVAMQASKNLTCTEFSRLAGRVFYETARQYGFRREYVAGNRKSAPVYY